MKNRFGFREELCDALTAAGALPATAAGGVQIAQGTPLTANGQVVNRGSVLDSKVAELLPLAQKGDAKAQMKLGGLYVSFSDLENGHYWEREALKTALENPGHPSSMYVRGSLYAVGAGGLREDMSRAVSLFKNAAEQGDVDSAMQLGHLYLFGMNAGLPPNEQEAIKWYQKAAELGDPNAGRIIEEIKSRSKDEFSGRLDPQLVLKRELLMMHGIISLE